MIARIESAPATTLDGVKLKLAAVDAIYRELPGGSRAEDLSDGPTTDMRLIVQILNTLRGL